MLNLDEYSFDKPVDVEIINPSTLEPTGAVFSVYCPHSKVARDIAIEQLRNRKSGEDPITDQEYYSKVITSWSGIGKDGKEVKCTPENIIDVLTEHTWIVTQLQLKLHKAGYSPKQ